MKMITISREFGSGGRELGKRLADELGCDYYDREIIAAIAAQKGMEENYVASTLQAGAWRQVPLVFGRSMRRVGGGSAGMELLVEQKKVIENIAKTGRDCVIVGRNADVLLSSYAPLSLFVCAQTRAKLARCAQRAPAGEQMSEREMERMMKRIDKARRDTRRILTDGEWGDPAAYDLVVNTTGWDIKELAPAVAEFAGRYFRRKC